MSQYAYTGDVKQLKSIGYIFQKLYANNYKTYHKDDIFMFVSNKMRLEISNLHPEHQAIYIKFILENKDKPKEFWEYTSTYPNGMTLSGAQYKITKLGRIIDHETWLNLRVEAMGEYYQLFKADTPKPTEDEIKTELDKSMLHEGGTDPFLIGWERVQAIIELNNLYPLERV